MGSAALQQPTPGEEFGMDGKLDAMRGIENAMEHGQFPADPSFCTFWSAVAIGALVKGSPIESVRGVILADVFVISQVTFHDTRANGADRSFLLLSVSITLRADAVPFQRALTGGEVRPTGAGCIVLLSRPRKHRSLKVSRRQAQRSRICRAGETVPRNPRAGNI